MRDFGPCINHHMRMYLMGHRMAPTTYGWIPTMDPQLPGIVVAMIARCRTVFPRYVRIFFWDRYFIADAHCCICSGSARFLEFQNLSAKVSPGLSSVVISYELAISWHYGKAQFKESHLSHLSLLAPLGSSFLTLYWGIAIYLYTYIHLRYYFIRCHRHRYR